jgi:hypothetical protein
VERPQDEAEEEQTTAHPEIPSASVTKESSSSATIPTKKSKTKKKKRKPIKDEDSSSLTPSARLGTPASPDFDELDRTLREISQKYGDIPPSPSPSTNSILPQKFSILSVSPKNLDADLELRKLFGKVVDAEAREARRQPIHGIPVRVINRIKASHTSKKHTLMKPKDEWQLFAAYNQRMLSMDIVTKEDGVTKFKFVHSKRYQDIQMQFFIAALGGDGNVLMSLLKKHPFHVDSWYEIPLIRR